jgi:hypothetical protein
MAKLRVVDAGWVAGSARSRRLGWPTRPLLAAAGAFRIAHAFLSGNRTDEALETARSAAVVLEPGVTDGSLDRPPIGRCFTLQRRIFLNRDTP